MEGANAGVSNFDPEPAVLGFLASAKPNVNTCAALSATVESYL